MGEAFDNAQCYDDEHFGQGYAECSGDGQIAYFSPMLGVYEHTVDCTKEPRDCSNCPVYLKEVKHETKVLLHTV